MDWGLPGHAWELQVTGYRLQVLHIGSQNMSLAAVHVGMTRVELPDDMRLFPVEDWRPLFRMSWDDELRHLMIELENSVPKKKRKS